MRIAAVFGLGYSPQEIKPFQINRSMEWRTGLPSAADEADIVMLFGGDGTIHRHLGQLVKLGLPVLIVPVGSGNDFARALGLRRVRDSLAAWSRFHEGRDNICAIDLGLISPLSNAGTDNFVGDQSQEQRAGAPAPQEPSYFCSVAGVGLDAEVARRANGLPRWLRGHGGYALSLASAIFHFVAFPMKIFATSEDGGWTLRSDRPTMLAAFANTSTYGDGMRIAPRARMDDGLLDGCVIGGVDRFKLACMFPTVYFGKHLSVREVGYFQAKRVRVETEPRMEIYADGEYVCRTPVEVSVQQEVLRVVVPAPR